MRFTVVVLGSANGLAKKLNPLANHVEYVILLVHIFFGDLLSIMFFLFLLFSCDPSSSYQGDAPQLKEADRLKAALRVPLRISKDSPLPRFEAEVTLLKLDSETVKLSNGSTVEKGQGTLVFKRPKTKDKVSFSIDKRFTYWSRSMIVNRKGDGYELVIYPL